MKHFIKSLIGKSFLLKGMMAVIGLGKRNTISHELFFTVSL